MATSPEEWLKTFEAAEKDFVTTLKQKEPEPTYAEVDTAVTRVRTAFENLFLTSAELAATHDAETRLWDVHSKINMRYRRQLSKFRDDEGKNRPVEKRKLEKHYLDFVKSSMKFYRRFIQRLASQYKGIPELSQIASRFNMDTTSLEAPLIPSDQTRNLILRSCHATLVRLGDLSRYRETELKSKERNWGPAIGYYDLATLVNPSSGLPHNQLAVIALAEGQHVRALYQLYRAQAVAIPHPAAKGNLEIEFKKIIQLKNKNELFPRGGPSVAERTVDAWFVYLHSRCDKGEEWSEHEDMENELLSQLSVLLKERKLEHQLQRYTLVNIAAEHMARQKAQADTSNPSFLLSFQFYERLNLKTFFMLLQILLPELADDDDGSDSMAKKPGEKLSQVARGILPSLRHYSSWLISNASYLVAQQNDPLLGVHIKEFWKIYASTLTLLAATFPVKDLPAIEYLLDEDEDTIGFVPLSNEATLRRYQGLDNILKPRHGGNGVAKELPSDEMLFRIRELLVDGIELTLRQDDSIPIELVEGSRFVYQEEGLPREIHASPPSHASHAHTPSAASINREDIERDRLAKHAYPAHLAGSRREDDRSTAAASTSNNTMNNMVNDLVGSETSSHSPSHPKLGQGSFGFGFSIPETTTANNSPLANRPITAQDLVQTMHRPIAAPLMERDDTISPLSSSIWTPMPGETSSPQLRSGSMTVGFDHAMTPLAKPTSSFFHDELHRQRQQVHARSSSINTPGTPSSWRDNTGFEHYRQGSGVPPWGPSPSWISPFPSTFTGHIKDSATEVPRNIPLQPQFGPIGQTPPSGQGG